MHLICSYYHLHSYSRKDKCANENETNTGQFSAFSSILHVVRTVTYYARERQQELPRLAE